MSITLHASPLQGFTDHRFRNAFAKFFGGIDYYYSPYIRLQGEQKIKKSEEKDILPQNNSVPNLIPQIMTKDANDFIFVAKYVEEMGYNELNWNLGCPYPMVAKRGLGSGLLKDLSTIDAILNDVLSNSEIAISLKMRLGYDDPGEISQVLPILDKYPIKNISIHPRIGKQLYKGPVDLESFQKCLENTTHKIIYNGDISSIDSFKRLKERFPSLDNWMIGRGLISDPFLPTMLKENTAQYPEDRITRFSKFHDTLFDEIQQSLSGPSHVTMKMYQYWVYFIKLFPRSPKGLKKIKKAKSISTYQQAVGEIFDNESKH